MASRTCSCYAEAEICREFNRCGSGEGVKSDDGGEGVGKVVMAANPVDREGDVQSVAVE